MPVCSTRRGQAFGSPDRGCLRTISLLVTAPGATLRGIIYETHRELTRPVRFMLFVFTLYSLVYISSGAMAILASDINSQTVASLNEALAARASVMPLPQRKSRRPTR